MSDAFDQWYAGLDSTLPKAPISRAKEAISKIETHGNYSSIGPTITHKNGKTDRALGKYQVMESNLPTWTKEALGKSLTAQQFLDSKEAQEAVFEHRFGQYMAKYGPTGAANMWFTGKPNPDPDARDALGTTAASYAKQFNTHFGKGGGTSRRQEISGSVTTLDDLNKSIEEDFAPVASPSDEPVLVDKRLPEWGVLPEVAQGAFFQKAPQILGALSAAKEVGRDMLQGDSFGNALQKARDIYYPQATGQWNEARDVWTADHGGAQVGANIAGGIPPTMLGVGAFNNALRGAAAAMPALRPMANFLGGLAGEGMEGVSGFLTRRASDAAAGAAQGAIGNAVTGQDPTLGAELGAPINMALGPVLRKLTAPLRAVARPEVAKAAQNYLQQGGDLPAAAILEDGHTRDFVRALAGNPDASVVEGFNRKLGERIGATPFMDAAGVRGLTPDVMAAVKDELYSKFDDFAANSQIIVDQQLMTDLFDINVDAAQNLGVARPEAAKVLKKTVDFIEDVAMNNISNGQFTISGKEFRQLTSSGGVLDQLFSADHTLTPFAERIRDSLYGALERTMPEAAKEIKDLRRQYSEFLKLRKVAASDETGLMNPKKVAAKYGKETGDFGELARMGHYLPATDPAGHVKMPEPSLLKNVLRHVPYGLGGGVIGGAIGAASVEHGLPWLPSIAENPMAAALGAGMGFSLDAGRRGFGKYLGSRNYLQRVIENSLTPQADAIVNPLIFSVPLMSQRDENWK